MIYYEQIKNYNVYKHEDLLADFLKQTYNINRVNLTIVKELEIEIEYEKEEIDETQVTIKEQLPKAGIKIRKGNKIIVTHQGRSFWVGFLTIKSD